FVSVLGWVAGVVPAIIDATIVVNSVMHNTLWVPDHFHTYLLLGTIAMVLGFMSYLARRETDGRDSFVFWSYLVGSAVFVLSFLSAGAAGVPRRFAVHLAEWQTYGDVGTIASAVVRLAALAIVVRFLARIGSILRVEA